MNDRRIHPRMAVEMRIQFRHLKRPEETFAELARNVSRGGMYVESSVALEVGTVVALDIRPGPGARPIRVRAEVAWVRDDPPAPGDRREGRPRGMGFRFVDLPATEVDRLLTLVRALARDEEMQ